MQKYLLKPLVILFTAGLLFASCKKNDSPLAGSDNAVTAFSLTVAGQTYDATISGNTITVSIPEGTSLRGATPAVVLCEQATMSPDPATITAWEEEVQFVVTAYNKERRTYLYKVQQVAINTSGNVLLTSQAEVDAFAATGVTLVEGNLVIGNAVGSTAADTITSLAGLSALRQVAYNVTINPTYAGSDLSGLERLEKVGGFKMAAIKSLTNITLPALQVVGTELNINISTAESVVLPELIRVGETLSIVADSINTLQLPSLEAVGGALTLKGSLGSSSKSRLTTLHLPALKSVGGLFTLFQWKNLLQIELPQLNRHGGMSCTFLPKMTHLTLPELTSAAGKITLNNCPEVVAMEIPKLTVATEVSVQTCPLLERLILTALSDVTEKLQLQAINVSSLEGLSALKRVGVLSLYNLPLTEVNVKGITITALELYGTVMLAKLIGDDTFTGKLYFNDASNKSIVDLPVMEGFRTVGSVEIYNLQLTEQFTMPNLQRVIGDLKLTSGSKIKTLTMPALKEVGGTVEISYLNSLNSLEMPLLESIGKDFKWSVSSNGLTTVGLPALKSIDGNFILTTGGYAVSTLAFPMLTTIQGGLVFSASNWSKNSTLTSLDGLSALKSVGKVTIQYYTALTSFAGLKNTIPTLNANAWMVTNCAYNPTFAQMQNGQYVQP